MSLMEIIEPSEFKTGLAQHIIDLRQQINSLMRDSSPLAAQVIPGIVEYPWQKKECRELLRAVLPAVDGVLRRRKSSIAHGPFDNRPALVQIPPNHGLSTRKGEILVFVPVAAFDDEDGYRGNKEVAIEFSARKRPHGQFSAGEIAPTGATIVGFENVSVRNSSGCRGILAVFRKSPS